MASRSSLIVSLIIFSFLGSCTGRFLENHPSSADHVDDLSTYTVDHHGHGDLKDYLFSSVARLFRFERSLIQEDEGTTIVNVNEFGANGDGTNDDTKAFEKAWEKACSSTGRTVLVVPQKRYIVKPITLEGPCKSNNLTVQIRGTIEISDNRSDYIYHHWLLFKSVQNLSVKGGGTLDGKGHMWWDHNCKFIKYQPCITKAPTALIFRECDNLVVWDLKVRNSPQMQVAFEKCNKVRASHLTVTAPGNAPNTDGIHITHSQDIEISNSDIGTGDDCISISSGTEKVRATDITCGPGHGISIGGLGEGAHVSDVIVDRAKFAHTSNGVRIKTWQGGSGIANNIKFLNIEMNNVYNPIIIDQNYCDRKNQCKEQYSAVQVRDVLYRNITGTSAKKVVVNFDCSRTFHCENIVLEDIDLRQHRGKHKLAEASCKNVELTEFGVVSPGCSHAHQGRKNDTTPPPVQPPVHDKGGKNDTAPPPVQHPGHDKGGKNDTAPPPVQPPGNNKGGKNDTAPPPVQPPGHDKRGKNNTAPPPVQQPGNDNNHIGNPTGSPVQRPRHHNNRRRHHHSHRRHHNNHRGGAPARPPVQQPVHDGNHKGGKNDTAPPVQQPGNDNGHKVGNPAQPPVQQSVFNVDDFGAKGNGKDDTETFNKAWERACSSKDAAFLVVPNKNYLVRPIRFGGPCKSILTVQIHGTIEASGDRSDYGEFGKRWLLFDAVDNLVVEGGGTLNGNGDVWWKHSCILHRSLPCIETPTALTFHKCENLAVRDLNIKNAQQMNVAFEHCNHVKASDLNVTAPGDSPNTDGIHVTHCQDIEIENCVIGTGDDCISIVSGSQNVRATNIICGPGHGISLGHGNSEAHVSDVIVRKSKFYGTTNGVRIKTWQGGSGNASNIKFIDIEMQRVRNPIIIDQNYCTDRQNPCKEQGSAVEVKDVLYQNITGTSTSDVAIRFDCSKSFACEGIVLRDVDLRRSEGDTAKAFCNNVDFTEIDGHVSPLCPH
ncbi:hypothetical protein L484_020875 [Morus notabilis]|uniref:endo-polygalacturonase n=1 Tax=Morus notabilis TaxID=981085 RepID=W9QRN9_9ROSA|nr:hypothetical protein L484_020875 [Morus notabilis]